MELHHLKPWNSLVCLELFVQESSALAYVSSPFQDVFHERVKIFKTWKETEANLGKKREQRAKLEQQRKLEKVPVIAHEITEVCI